MSRYVKKYPDSIVLVCPRCKLEYLFLRDGKSSLTYHVSRYALRCSCDLPLVPSGGAL